MTKRFAAVVFVILGMLALDAPAKAVVGGTPVSGRPYPFMAAVYRDGSFLCSGSIISPNWVLAAAHCVAGAETASYSVSVGSNSRSGGTFIAVSQAIPHPQYDSSDFINDVSLLHLATPTNQPALELANFGDDDLETQGALSQLIGWGDKTPTLGLLAPDALQSAQVSVVDDNNCFGESASANAQTTVCSQGLLKGTCNGDSGGPVVGFKRGHFVQIGVVSNGLAVLCGYANQIWPDELAEVNAPSIRNWIAGTSGI
jgi:secreted trypsin-like serine protease